VAEKACKKEIVLACVFIDTGYIVDNIIVSMLEGIFIHASTTWSTEELYSVASEQTNVCFLM